MKISLNVIITGANNLVFFIVSFSWSDDEKDKNTSRIKTQTN